MSTYVTSQVVFPFVRYIHIPQVLVSIQPLDRLDYAHTTTRMQLENDDICSLPEFTGVYARLGAPKPFLLAAAASGGWDTIQYALLVHMLAQVCGYQPGTLVHIVNNLHIYDRHVDLVKEVMENPEYPGPQLKLNPEVKDFYDFTEDDFELVGYQSTKLTTKFEVAE